MQMTFRKWRGRIPFGHLAPVVPDSALEGSHLAGKTATMQTGRYAYAEV
ncbi:hypothetical protein X742_23200 [Mesorhizobium sp. LNHC232B00]|nr:hypothetical protein X742_23200 [Mesorhizobium sp. LNHC232B00]